MTRMSDMIQALEAEQTWDHVRDRLASSDPGLIGCSYGRIHNLMRDGNLLPNILPREEKSDRLSEEIRNKGNIAYTRAKDNKAAIQLYTKAICAALPNSKDMALAYANRSAVTFDIGLEFTKQTDGMYAFLGFNDSIRDIDCALSSGSYPDHLKYKLYKRRGECLKNQGKHSDAVGDLELAKTHIQNSGLAPDKMESTLSLIDYLMKTTCGKPYMPSEVFLSFPTDITLSCEPSPYIDCASSAVDITYFPLMGRGVVAAKEIFPGDVLAIEKCYASTLFPEFLLDHCDSCMEKCLSPIPCASCRTIVYCSEKCRQSSWTSYHSMECRILPSLQSHFSATNLNIDQVLEVHLALRMFLIASKCGEDFEKLLKNEPKPSDPSKSGFMDGKYLSNDYSSVHHLFTNFESYSDKFKIMYIGHAIALMRLLRRGTTFFENLDTSLFVKQSNQCCPSVLASSHLTIANLLLKFLMIVQINSVEVIEAGSVKTGIAIYPFFSLINHTCDANVAHIAYAGDTIFAVAIQPIPRGHQVLTNYRVNFKVHPRSIRQQQLERYHRFTCKCTPCVEDWPQMATWPQEPVFTQPYGDDKENILSMVQAVGNVLELMKNGEGTAGALRLLVGFMELVYRSVKLPWEPYTRAQRAIIVYRSYQAYPELPIIFRNENSVLARERDLLEINA